MKNIHSKILFTSILSLLFIFIVINFGIGSGTIITANVLSVGERSLVKGAPLHISITALTPEYKEVKISIPPFLKIKAGDSIELLEKEKYLSNEKFYSFYNPDGKGLTSVQAGLILPHKN